MHPGVPRVLAAERAPRELEQLRIARPAPHRVAQRHLRRAEQAHLRRRAQMADLSQSDRQTTGALLPSRVRAP